MKIVTAEAVREKLTIPKCMAIMRDALCQLETGEAQQPLRTVEILPNGEAFGFMPAYLGNTDYFGAKILTAFHANMGTNYPSHMGYVMLFESVHGAFVGMADATVITEVRTGAVSGVATDLLARKDASTLALIGAGAQARSHLRAVCEVRPIKTVFVYDLSVARSKTFIDEMTSEYPQLEFHVAKTAKEAVADADIICTLTPSQAPFLESQWVKPGTHINAVGTFSPTTREVTSELVARSKFYADQVEAMKRECGEYLIPKAEGLIDETHIRGSIGALLLGRIEGRTSDEEVTLFDALGLAVEDVACARYLCVE
ncbi:MAG: hypothetical protein PWP51_1334 [Clostridiales bacterium]|jgi:ornithine cyclodeaminase|nr:hypothetical protein [Clostridiales bacterium]MDN5298781.1 hypothetical protein [Clostridiales bacterium]